MPDEQSPNPGPREEVSDRERNDELDAGATAQKPPREVNRPVKTFSCPASAGVYIEAAVWGREYMIDDRSVTMYSATLQKKYKTDAGWAHTAFLRTPELAVAVHVLQLAATWMLNARTTEDPPPS